MTTLRLSLTLTASTCLAAAATAHGGCQDNNALLQTSYEVFKQASMPKLPSFHLPASVGDADPTSLVLPGTPMQVFRTVVFLCSCVAAILAYLRVDPTRSKAHDGGVLRQFQILESLAHMNRGDAAAPAKSESDRDTAVDTCARSDSTDTCTDTDVDTDSEDEMYDGHDFGEAAQQAPA